MTKSTTILEQRPWASPSYCAWSLDLDARKKFLSDVNTDFRSPKDHRLLDESYVNRATYAKEYKHHFWGLGLVDTKRKPTSDQM